MKNENFSQKTSEDLCKLIEDFKNWVKIETSELAREIRGSIDENSSLID